MSRWLFAAVLLLGARAAAQAQVVGVALDGKATLVDGELAIVAKPPPDRVVFFEFANGQRKELGRVAAPNSFQGPPSSIAITPDRRWAVVTAFMRIDPADPSKLAPNQTLAIIDLAARPIRVVQTLALGAAPSSVALHPGGSLALVPHTADDSVTIVELAAGRARVVEKRKLEEGSAPLAAAFSPDGKRALISYPKAGKVAVFAVDGGKLGAKPVRELSAGIWPTALAFCGSSGLAVVSNYGKVTGDADTISLIDAAAATPRVIDTATVGPSPEGIACPRDGRYAAVAVQNMSTVERAHPLHAAASKLVVLRIDGKRLRAVAEAPFGAWAQGVGFLDDSRTVFAQSMTERTLSLFKLDGDRLQPAGPAIRFDAGPSGYGVSPAK